MPTGIRPRVNEAREFLEVAKDLKDPAATVLTLFLPIMRKVMARRARAAG